jgi:hypothetical protein
MAQITVLARNATEIPRFAIRYTLVLAAAILFGGLSGCATWKGAPQAPFNEDSFTGAKSPISLTPEDLQELLNTEDEGRRNALLRRTLADMDVRYLAFASEVVQGKSRFDFGKNMLVLSSSIASSLTPSAGVKANYAALSALLTGGGAQVDSNFLYNQTSLALVSMMDAQRAVVLADIRHSMSQSIQEYPGQTAFGDAIRYFRAGTLASAAQELQKSAAGKASTEEAKLRDIHIPTDAEVARAIKRGQSFAAYVNDKKHTAAVRGALIAIKVEGVDKSTSDEDVRAIAKDYYRRYNSSGEADDLIAELKKNGFVPN